MNGRSLDLLTNKGLIESIIKSQPHRRLYFHYGFWCSLDPNDVNVANFCEQQVKKNYELTPVIELERRDTKYVLYEIIGIKDN